MAFTKVTVKGSSASGQGSISTSAEAVAECREPAAEVIIQNADTTATNTLAVALNNAAVTTSTGHLIPGANGCQRIRLSYGDVLYAVAGAARDVRVTASVIRS